MLVKTQGGATTTNTDSRRKRDPNACWICDEIHTTESHQKKNWALPKECYAKTFMTTSTRSWDCITSEPLLARPNNIGSFTRYQWIHQGCADRMSPGNAYQFYKLEDFDECGNLKKGVL